MDNLLIPCPTNSKSLMIAVLTMLLVSLSPKHLASLPYCSAFCWWSWTHSTTWLSFLGHYLGPNLLCFPTARDTSQSFPRGLLEAITLGLGLGGSTHAHCTKGRGFNAEQKPLLKKFSQPSSPYPLSDPLLYPWFHWEPQEMWTRFSFIPIINPAWKGGG